MMRHHGQVSQPTVGPADPATRSDAQRGRARVDPERLQGAFDVVARQVSSGLVPSAVLAVADTEGMIRLEAISGTDEAAVDSIYLLASISKPIVATAVMQLVERGRLVLSEPVQRYLPAFGPAAHAPGLPGAEAITPRHLLAHTSGMADFDLDLLQRERPDRQRLLEIAYTFPLRFVPGSRYEYNTLAFAVLGELFRQLDGRDYPAYLAEDLLVPLGMVSTAFSAVDDRRAVRAAFPGFPSAFQSVVGAYYDSMQAPGGGLWGTAHDVVAFGRAILSGGELDGRRVLGRPFVELMTSDQTAGVLEAGDPPRPAHYGLGWGLPVREGFMPGSLRTFGHGGGTGTRLWVDPDAGLVIVYLTNSWTVGPAASFAAIAAVYGAIDR
jgi:CubicO group peptidase (beta-lactamase class C family)